MRRLLQLALLAAAPAAFGDEVVYVAPDVSHESGILKIVPIDPRGALISGPISVSVRRIERERPQVKTEIEPKSKLPYGRYEITVTVPGFNFGRQTVNVNSRYQVAMVPLSIGALVGGAGRYVRGSLPERSRRLECIWARLVPLLSDSGTRATRATGAGIYAFEDVQPGRYLLVTHGRDGVCDTVELAVQ